MTFKPMTVALILPILGNLCFAQMEIPEGTRIRVRLEQQLSSATAEEGQPVQLSVVDDVKVDDITVIAQGATATGTVVQAVPKRRMGRTGKLDFSIDKVVTVDGNSVPLRYSPVKKEGGSHAVRTGIITAAAAVVFWPVAPVFLLAHGKDATFSRGLTLDVFTDSKYVLKPKAFTSSFTTQSSPAQAALLLASQQIGGGGQGRPLTNADILALKNAAILDDVIIAKIRSAPAQYKLDTEDLIELKKSGVSDSILQAMLEASKR
jgi:hypothetical protein